MIALTGANGKLGRDVTRLLGADPAVPHFRALARNPTEAQQANPVAKAEFVQADFDDVAGLTTALQGVERLLLISTPDPNDLRIRRQRQALQTAQAAGVRHVIYLSFLVADGDSPFPFAESHAATEQTLRELFPEAWTILRPSLYLDAVAMVAAEVGATGSFRVPAGQAKVSFISRHDIAQAAARILTSNGHEQKIYPLTGGTSHTYAEIADTLSLILDKPISYTEVDEATYREQVGSQLPPPMLDAFVAIWRTIREGWFAPITADAEHLIGHAPQTLQQWLSENKALFS